MRRCALALAGFVSLNLVVGSVPAAASLDVGFDPADTEDGLYDIRSTVRRVEGGEHGRILDVKVRTYDDSFGSRGTVRILVLLDTKGRTGANAVLIMRIGHPSLEDACWLARNPKSLALIAYGRFRVPNPGSIACRVKVRPLHPERAIRWKVSTIRHNEILDEAPDGGWYG